MKIQKVCSATVEVEKEKNGIKETFGKRGGYVAIGSKSWPVSEKEKRKCTKRKDWGVAFPLVQRGGWYQCRVAR